MLHLETKSARISGRRVTSAAIRKVEIDETEPEIIAPAPDIGSASWIVAMTEPRAEAKAIEALTDAGYPVFCPFITRWRRHGFRQDKIAVPLFPRYLFVGLVSGPAYPVARCKSIAMVIGNASGPVVIRRHVVEHFSRRQTAGAYDETRKPSDRFKPGEAVTVSVGPFASIPATVVRMAGDERVAILMSILGSQTLTEAPATALRKAG